MNHGKTLMNAMKTKIIINWQKKNHQLNQAVIDSLEGLDVWETILALGMIRKVIL